MIITYVYADNNFEWNTSNWRCVIPSRAINRTGKHTAHLMSLVDFNKGLKESQHLCEQSDIIVVERNFALDTLNAILRWKSKDKVVVGNFDDAYQLMPSSNSSYGYWMKGEMRFIGADGKEGMTIIKPRPLDQFIWGLRILDAITVSSQLLADDWKEYTDSYYFPNYFEVNNYLKAAAPYHDGIIIGWGGSLSHIESFKDGGVLPALKQVCKQRPQVKVMIVGDKRVYDMLDVPEEQKIFRSFVPYDLWPNVISEFDIGLAPLHGPYDSRRSWIKPLEYSLLKIPWIASDNPAYEEVRDYGVLVNGFAGWQSALLDMVDNITTHRQRVSGEPYRFALKQSSDQNVETMLKIYAEIIYKSTGRVMKI
ncbi:MAG: hypothetical protein LWX83_02370 [Anaerolineae bacterium]|nr:hypothetical protein [Anaerolineae bacterium]